MGLNLCHNTPVGCNCTRTVKQQTPVETLHDMENQDIPPVAGHPGDTPENVLDDLEITIKTTAPAAEEALI